MPILSVIHRPGLVYPEASEGFSPSAQFPEYRFPFISTLPNPIYTAVRECFAQAGLDADNFGTSHWNPLGGYARPGQQVFVLCNFVYHRRPQESRLHFYGKCTHAAVVRAVIDYLLIAVGPEGRVLFGNSPVQSCNWESVLRETGAAALVDFYGRVGAQVSAKDLRMIVAERDAFGQLTRYEARDIPTETVSIDLGSASALDATWSKAAPFRVHDYSPTATETHHGKGRHVYVVHRAVLESDLIFSIPKLKTHEKVGVTCCTKGCVGAVGSKDCLAHHRRGSSKRGGDEYQSDPTGLLRLVSAFHEAAYRRPAAALGVNAMRIVDRFLRSGLRRLVAGVGGGWWGNDTAWRMAVDLAAIVEYADRTGVVRSRRIRPHIALIDGVVGGDRAGPLNPSPVDSSLLLFSDDPVAADFAAASAMGFDPMRVPVIAVPWSDTNSPLWRAGRGGDAVLNGTRVSIASLRGMDFRRFEPPAGWKGMI